MPTPPLAPKSAAGSPAARPEDRHALQAELRECLRSINRDLDYLRVHLNNEELLAELVQIVRQIEQELSSVND